MMDHARHLSSPSPTSPFLFHHSERSFKSNPLTPLLSSAAEVTNVDDCFSTSASSITNHENHNPFPEQHHSLIDSHHSSSQVQVGHQRHKDQDSLTGVNDDDDDDDDVDEDGMHNMLSGSSTSSTSTMPLLTEAHSHHSFTRISLEEYSPLSLVEDCDNALPMSPTSLACGSHHSFKSSLNVSKMENLVGESGLHDHDVQEDVNDARSLSPSLINTSNASHNNLWSYSSTAISQNTALLTSTSTSFLLSQHHQQLNSFIQQLEPQSLDEAPPIINHSSNNIDSTSILEANTQRPSSEPLPEVALPKLEVNKSLDCSQLDTKQANKHQTVVRSAKATSSSRNNTATSSPSSKRIRNRVKSATKTLKQQVSAASTTSSGNSKSSSQEKLARASANASNAIAVSSSLVSNGLHDSKLHLQLNHQKKLQELQQRLFGTTLPSKTNEVRSSTGKQSLNETGQAIAAKQTSSSDAKLKLTSAEEPDSSAGSKDEEAATTSNQASQTTNQNGKTVATKSRRSRKAKNGSINAIQTSVTLQSNQAASNSVSSEPDEPDTTTKSSDCVKLADLLSSGATLIPTISQDYQGKLSFNGFSSMTTDATNRDGDNGDRKLQQIQLQVSPSLTVVTNGGLMQPISVQQQQQQVTGATITTNGQALANHIFCRPQVVGTGSTLKSLITDHKGDVPLSSGWSLQATNSSANNNGTSNNGQQTLGAHHIAIQVICQDGTSLVLPVSSSAALNNSISLGSGQPQLQAVLTSASNNQQRTTNQLLPLMSVSNLTSQQLQVSKKSSDGKTNGIGNGKNNSNSTSSTSSQSCCGLAASSPTLAALLDAGSNCNNGELTSQNLVTTNLLRKLVTGGSAELRKGEMNLPQGSTINLANGSIVTVCTPKSNSKGQTANLSGTIATRTGDKRIKLEISNPSDSLNLVDRQAAMEKVNGQQKVSSTDAASKNIATQVGANKCNKDASRPGKLASSTGNRQVDPTQPFRCEHCNSTFTRLGNFTRHKKIHTVPTKVSYSKK